MNWHLRGQATNQAVAPEFVVALDEPLPWVSSLVVLDIRLRVDSEAPIALRVRPASNPSVPPDPFGLPAYARAGDPGSFRTLGYSFGWNAETGVPNWCAIINPRGDCNDDPTGAVGVSWGLIKSLYR